MAERTEFRKYIDLLIEIEEKGFELDLTYCTMVELVKGKYFLDINLEQKDMYVLRFYKKNHDRHMEFYPVLSTTEVISRIDEVYKEAENGK